jgi:hypothetical protein
VAYTYNLGYSGGRNQKDYGLKSTQANKNTITKEGLVDWLKV